MLWSSLAVEWWERDEANLPRHEVPPLPLPMMDTVTSEAELLSLVKEAYTQEHRRKVVRS